uniref:Uncharacterized protein n=1 Tax=Gopherus agassizii TaxID=38772 RepID=A0A452GPI3_9SAUR
MQVSVNRQNFNRITNHLPQECYGLLECMHNNIQIQTQIALTQLSILEGLQESMNLLLAKVLLGSKTIVNTLCEFSS